MSKVETLNAKRKHVEDAVPAELVVSPPAKKPKKAKQSKSKPGEDFDDSLGINLAIGRMDGHELVQYVDSRIKSFEREISEVELGDKRIPVNAITDTSFFEKSRTTDNLTTYLNEMIEQDLKETPQVNGAPHTLVVAGAGLRAADLTRTLREYQTKDAVVAKFFAKHIKLKESVDLCKKKKVTIGVGTPQRILDLFEDGALSSKSLKRIIIDASHVDQKRRGILEMKDTLTPLLKLLHLRLLKERFASKSDGIEILFY